MNLLYLHLDDYPEINGNYPDLMGTFAHPSPLAHCGTIVGTEIDRDKLPPLISKIVNG